MSDPTSPNKQAFNCLVIFTSKKLFQKMFKCLARNISKIGSDVETLVPGVVLIPLRIGRKLNMTKFENIMKNKDRREKILKIHRRPRKLLANKHAHLCSMAGAC